MAEIEEYNDSSTKKIIIETNSTKKTVKTGKDKVKRIITDTKKWTNNIKKEFLEQPLNQRKIIEDMYNNCINDSTQEHAKIITQQIHQKINGYRAQDIEKQKYESDKIVDSETILEKLHNCNVICYYCKDPVLVLYEYVREPKQWTVERIDNAFGHNKDNIEIACLRCNLRRRIMSQERYVLTKQMSIITKLT